MAKTIKTNETDSLMPDSVINRRAKSARSYLPWIIIAVVVIGAGLFALQQRQQAKDLQAQLEDLKQNPQKANEEETKALLAKVGELIQLPDEQPTIATVTDLAPLKDQPFFASAQVGDKVLIFSQAKKAVLYRPSTNKVIEIAPVDLDAQAANVNTNTKATNKNTNDSSTNSNKNTSSNSNTNSDN
jgi:hypothetical protein